MVRRVNNDMLLRKFMFNISTLEDLGKVLSSSEDFKVRLRTALSSIMGSLPVAKGGFFIYHGTEGEGGWIELAVTRGVDVAPGIALPLPDDILGAFLGEGKTIFRANPPASLREYLASYSLIFDGLKAHVLQPLVFKKEFLGLVCLGRKFSEQEFAVEDLELLRIMANYSSIGIHNQHLLLNLERTNVALRKKAVENSRLYADLQEMYQDTVKALGAAIDAKDPYTRGHSDRVAQFSVAIARRLGMNQDEISGLNLASHLHDIGKIAIDNSILLKPQRLDEDEAREIHRHPQISFDILSNIRFPYRDVALLTKHHHERLNGGGYPEGRRGDDLTTGMRILALADAFDAMTSDRPYRPALSVEAALEEISRCVYVQFDLEVTRAFLTALREEMEGGAPLHGIIHTMGKPCDAGHLNPMLDRLLTGLDTSVAH